MEIAICKTQKYMYYGERNDTVEKEGWGIVYDEEGGKMVLEGIWSKGILIEVIRCFVGDTMTEWKRNEKDSLDPLKRIPLQVGGLCFNEDIETFAREGKGCLIDGETGIATTPVCEWKDGKEASGMDLYDE